MKTAGCTGVFWLIFVLGLSAVPRGEWEAQALQGELVRLAVSWQPSEEQEGRWWWEPQGGSAWVRAGGFQVGPLVGVAAVEGAKSWGPGTRLSSGNWGVAYLGDWGLWAVQKPETFEAGAQYRADAGLWTFAAGGERIWNLGLEAPLWTDSARLGASWSAPGWGGGAEFKLGRDSGGGVDEAASGRLALDRGPWEAEVSGSLTGRTDWKARGRAGWRSAFLTLMGAADRAGPEVYGRIAVAWLGVDAGLESDVRFEKQTKAEGAISLKGGPEPAKWWGEWRLGQGRGLHQQVTVGWKTPSFEVEARWKAESLRLGWLGADATFGLSWKMLW